MTKLFTIGFTKKSAEKFFGILKENNINLVVDVRLNNVSQLSGFSKFPDIQFFLKTICDINYQHDLKFSPEESTLSRYKKKNIDWNTYVCEFTATMQKREIRKYIAENYNTSQNICLLCSENEPEHCHRRLVAEIFQEVFPELEVIHL